MTDKGRLTYTVEYYGEFPKADHAYECVEIIGDDEIAYFNPRLTKKFPNYGIEFYGPLPSNPEPLMFIHADKEKMTDCYDYNKANRIAYITYKNNKTDRFYIRKDVYEEIWK